jgi:hypothetical protein
MSNQFAARANHGFKFNKRGQFFIRSHNETFFVVAMRVCYPDRSTVAVDGSHTAQLHPVALKDMPVPMGTGRPAQGTLIHLSQLPFRFSRNFVASAP